MLMLWLLLGLLLFLLNYDGATDFELRKGLKFGGRKNMKTERNETKRNDGMSEKH